MQITLIHADISSGTLTGIYMSCLHHRDITEPTESQIQPYIDYADANTRTRSFMPLWALYAAEIVLCGGMEHAAVDMVSGRQIAFHTDVSCCCGDGAGLGNSLSG